VTKSKAEIVCRMWNCC